MLIPFVFAFDWELGSDLFFDKEPDWRRASSPIQDSKSWILGREAGWLDLVPVKREQGREIEPAVDRRRGSRGFVVDAKRTTTSTSARRAIDSNMTATSTSETIPCGRPQIISSTLRDLFWASSVVQDSARAVSGTVDRNCGLGRRLLSRKILLLSTSSKLLAYRGGTG